MPDLSTMTNEQLLDRLSQLDRARSPLELPAQRGQRVDLARQPERHDGVAGGGALGAELAAAWRAARPGETPGQLVPEDDPVVPIDVDHCDHPPAPRPPCPAPPPSTGRPASRGRSPVAPIIVEVDARCCRTQSRSSSVRSD